MRIHNDKKQNLFLSFEKLLKTKTSIFFISVTQLTIKEKILLKNEFEKFGLKFIVVKNKVFTKQIEENFPKLQNLIPLVQGFCIALYPLDSKEQTTIEDLKQLGTFLDKHSNLLITKYTTGRAPRSRLLLSGGAPTLGRLSTAVI